MKKYSSGSFVDAAVRVYGSKADTISSFPASIITNGGNITPWIIYGNTSAGQSVGEKTPNLCQDLSTWVDGFINASGNVITDASSVINQEKTSQFIDITGIENITFSYPGGFPSIEGTAAWRGMAFYDETEAFISRTAIATSTALSLSVPENTKYVRATFRTFGNTTNPMLNSGSTALPYEPYGYKLPVVIGNTTTNIYMADVLRMSSGADPVYDIMSSTGTITRNVDTDGSPLVTPTTESFTAPTLATVAGSQSFTIDTTVKPSSVSLTYTGWHTHADKQYSGGSWGQVTSNAKVLRRKKFAKSKT